MRSRPDLQAAPAPIAYARLGSGDGEYGLAGRAAGQEGFAEPSVVGLGRLLLVLAALLGVPLLVVLAEVLAR